MHYTKRKRKIRSIYLRNLIYVLTYIFRLVLIMLFGLFKSYKINRNSKFAKSFLYGLVLIRSIQE